MGTADRQGGTQRGAMAADGGCGESVEEYRAEVERLTQELAEANREKIRAAECGLVVLEENQALKQKYVDLETEQESLRKELEQLQEVRGPGSAALGCMRSRISASRCSSYAMIVCCDDENSLCPSRGESHWEVGTRMGRQVVFRVPK